MSEKRFTLKTEKLQHLDDEVIMVVDNANEEWKGHILNIVDLMNELNDERMMYKTTIDKRIVELKEENKQLRKQIHNIGYAIEKAVSDLMRTEEVYLADFDIVKRISEYEKEFNEWR